MADRMYLSDLWVEAETAGVDEPELLRYRSNLLGRDLRLTNYGGGNTSSKIRMADPVTGENVTVLWVKGSGGDLGTIKRDGFATLYQDRLDALKKQYRGQAHEDEMVDLYPLCTFGANTRAASIDTPLHGFLPYPHVDHLHPDCAIALAACANGPAHLRQMFEETGLKLAWLPWKRPGFELGLWLEKCDAENPGLDGIILGSHGIFTWGPTGRQSYLNTINVIDQIGQYVLKYVEKQGDKLFGGITKSVHPKSESVAMDLMPVIRGQVGAVIGHFEGGSEVHRFIHSDRAEALAWQGTSCPDHFVRTKVRPLFLPLNLDQPESWLGDIQSGFEKYRADYLAYYDSCKHPDSPKIRLASPSVVLVPGVGMFSFGKNKAEARITGEFYINAIHVMEGATSMGGLEPDATIPPERIVDNYVALTPQEAFNIEYWSLEEAKLQRMPPEKELSRKVAVVFGASAGIGAAVALRLAKEGAHVVIADIRLEAAQEVAERVASACGKEVTAADSVDCTIRSSVHDLYRRVAGLYGGVDVVVQTAAVFFPPDSQTGRVTDEQWHRTLDVNLFGCMVAADEAYNVFRKQGSFGSIILLSSANALVPKKGSWAYDTGKAALNHLVREMAVEFADHARVNGVAPASVVEGSVQFPRDRVISSLTKYAIAHSIDETTDQLREKLAGYYADRTILKRKVLPCDVAEACGLLASERLSRTTGQIIAVDAGLTEAFLR